MASFSADEISKHCTKDDAWLILDGKVYDVTEFAKSHPGGDAIFRKVGKDATIGFHHVPSHGMVKTLIEEQLQKMCLGTVDETL